MVLRRMRRIPSDCGDRPGLQQEQRTVGVEGPFDGLRAPIQAGQMLAEPRELHALCVLEDLLADDAAALDDALTVEHVMIGSDLTGDDLLAEPECRLDDHAVLPAVYRVDGEQDP